jgi:RNA polymerase sigma factor (sigma-70 family)
MNATLPTRDNGRTRPASPWVTAESIPVPSAELASKEALVGLLWPMLSRIARRYEPDRQLCPDLQQEMLIALWLSLDSADRKESFRGWLRRVTSEVGTRHVMAREGALPVTGSFRDGAESSRSPDPESVFVARERLTILLGLLDNLRPREREVVLLDLEEFDSHEIGAALQCSASQARDTLARAHRRLHVWMRRSEPKLAGGLA